MSMRRMIGFSGALTVVVALTMALPGCGGGSAHEIGPTGEVKLVTPPGGTSAQEEYK